MDCIFCKIANGTIPVDFLYSDELVVAFNDIAPKAKTHILIVPRVHLSSASELKKEDSELLSRIFQVTNELAEKMGINESGYRIITNHGKDAGQSVDHLHFHLVGGNDLGDIVGK